jgi:hypothetical protein
MWQWKDSHCDDGMCGQPGLLEGRRTISVARRKYHPKDKVGKFIFPLLKTLETPEAYHKRKGNELL